MSAMGRTSTVGFEVFVFPQPQQCIWLCRCHFVFLEYWPVFCKSERRIDLCMVCASKIRYELARLFLFCILEMCEPLLSH